jgi:tripartite-type tricarboxylate transporter receptor subunit TctC
VKAFLRPASALVFLYVGAAELRAETYPSRPVEFIVAYPAGGAADVIARSVAQRLSQLWGQTVIVDNRVGGDPNCR